MGILDTTADFMSGLQTIERAIIGRVRREGGSITAWHFSWNRGRPLASSLRTIVPLDITCPAGHFESKLTYEQVADSAIRIERADVLDFIRDAATALHAEATRSETDG